MQPETTCPTLLDPTVGRYDLDIPAESSRFASQYSSAIEIKRIGSSDDRYIIRLYNVSDQIPHNHLHQAGTPAVNDAASRTAALGYLLVSRRSASGLDPEAVHATLRRTPCVALSVKNKILIPT